MSNVPQYIKHEHFFKSLQKAKSEVIPAWINSSSDNVIKSIVEIAFNILKGTVHLTERDLNRFTLQKDFFKKLTSQSVTLKSKRNLLAENPKLLKHMLKIVFRK